MNLQRTQHSHRGVIGVESAIVMIAFVIVAAALAFVVLNMGFSTTQKVKTITTSSLEEASSAMEISGTVYGIGCTSSASGCDATQKINATIIPIKIAAGGNLVNFAPDITAISFFTKDVEYTNIYAGTITTDEYKQPVLAFRQAALEAGSAFDAFNGANPINGTLPSETTAFVYWPKRLNTNSILEAGEHAVLAVGFADTDRPLAHQKISIEIMLSDGGTLTIDRIIPNITRENVDFG
ncbi:archaellin/type IV pilin N-terminal domain-containing protein [Candidatus Nitrosarchaeum limnium]|uniref:Flagellin n=1 Tax=Candidatus Nitrosarchaeum limnium BG20 TaxID=859192 RepID=S2EPE1_9ARCH|nr:archaellin/type IV pilin N-terminal domain-containing protein [Candidatus Nitrosarchaeum limnium]EPA06332.1 archaeal flagellin N-terminal-like domain protein [Candidatus Nitrosarchaeum limnium BG20]